MRPDTSNGNSALRLFDLERATMLAKDLPAPGEPEAETSPRLSTGEKRIEQVLALDLVKPWSVVRNKKYDGVGISVELNPYVPTVLQGFQTVSNQA